MTPIPRSCRGMTLVELMVAVAIGLFLVAVMGSIYLGSKGTFVAQDALARLQENGRFAVDTLATDLRMAGYRGCLAPGLTVTAPVNTLNNGNTLPYNFGTGLWATHGTGPASWTPSLPAEVTALPKVAPLTAGDIVVVRRPTGSAWSLVSQMNPPNNGTGPLVISAGTDIKVGDLLMISDCTGAAVLQATDFGADGANVTILHAPGSGTPGLASNDLKRSYGGDALLHRMATNMYYLGNSARRAGATSLYLCDLSCFQGGDPTELVTGVERFAVTIGVDTGATPDGQADEYVAPGDVLDWTRAVSAKIEMVMVSGDDRLSTSPQKYVFQGTEQTPTDLRLRVVMATTSSLRNASP